MPSLIDTNSGQQSGGEDKIELLIAADPNIRSFYIIPPKQKLRKVIQRFCRDHKIDMRLHHFQFDDRLISAGDTPHSLEMSTGDRIDCWSYTLGA